MPGYVTGTATDSDLEFGTIKPTGLLGQNPAQIGTIRVRATTTTRRDVQSDGYAQHFGLSERPRELIRKKLSA